MFFSALQNNGYLYLAVVDELKKLKEEKELKESIQKNYFMKKNIMTKLNMKKIMINIIQPLEQSKIYTKVI
jgi:hypothetical protein